MAKFIDSEGSHEMMAECLHPTALRVVAGSMGQSTWAGNGRRMYLYNPLSEYPKRFTFHLRLRVPPDKADQRIVEFKDMPVR
jgi:hypothetical protein